MHNELKNTRNLMQSVDLCQLKNGIQVKGRHKKAEKCSIMTNCEKKPAQRAAFYNPDTKAFFERTAWPS